MKLEYFQLVNDSHTAAAAATTTTTSTATATTQKRAVYGPVSSIYCLLLLLFIVYLAAVYRVRAPAASTRGIPKPSIRAEVL